MYGVPHDLHRNLNLKSQVDWLRIWINKLIFLILHGTFLWLALAKMHFPAKNKTAFHPGNNPPGRSISLGTSSRAPRRKRECRTICRAPRNASPLFSLETFQGFTRYVSCRASSAAVPRVRVVVAVHGNQLVHVSVNSIIHLYDSRRFTVFHF